MPGALRQAPREQRRRELRGLRSAALPPPLLPEGLRGGSRARGAALLLRGGPRKPGKTSFWPPKSIGNPLEMNEKAMKKR